MFYSLVSSSVRWRVVRDSRHERCSVSGAEESASLSTAVGVSHVHMMSDPVRGQLATKFLDTISMTSVWWEKEGEEERKGEIRSVLSINLSPWLLQCSRSCGTGTRERSGLHGFGSQSISRWKMFCFLQTSCCGELQHAVLPWCTKWVSSWSLTAFVYTFLKEEFNFLLYAHKGCLCLVKNTVKRLCCVILQF